MAAVANVDWTGATRTDLEAEHAVVDADADSVVNALFALANELSRGADAAEAEQAARVADRHRYRDEVLAANLARDIPP
ncbi:MAG: hypothetical protein WKF93_11065 [Acidimicrobiales bacterium]